MKSGPIATAAYTVAICVRGGRRSAVGNAIIGPGRWMVNGVSGHGRRRREPSCAPASVLAQHLRRAATRTIPAPMASGAARASRISIRCHRYPRPRLSKFLTGGGPGMTFNVADTQPGTGVVWPYAELERPARGWLWDLAQCTTCMANGAQDVGVSRRGWHGWARCRPIPVPTPSSRNKIGPITDINVMKQILTLRTQVHRQPRVARG